MLMVSNTDELGRDQSNIKEGATLKIVLSSIHHSCPLKHTETEYKKEGAKENY